MQETISSELIESVNYIDYKVNNVSSKCWYVFRCPFDANRVFYESKWFYMQTKLVRYFTKQSFKYIVSKDGIYLFVLGYTNPLYQINDKVIQRFGKYLTANATMIQIADTRYTDVETLHGYSEGHLEQKGNNICNVWFNNNMLTISNPIATFAYFNLELIGVVPVVRPKPQWIYSKLLTNLITGA